MVTLRSATTLARALGLILLCTGCATQRPVLYPNTQYQAADRTTVDADIEACIQLANASGAGNDKNGGIATDAAGNAAVGAAAGAAGGAVYGNAGRGAVAGAAAAGAGSLVRGLLRSGEPGSLHRSFVEKCLRDKGYQPIGWK